MSRTRIRKATPGRRLPLWGLLLVFCLLAPSQASARWIRYAVVAGQNRGFAQEDALRYAERDARQVAALLTGPGGVAPDQLALLTGPGRAELLEALEIQEAKIQRGNAVGHDTVLIVYYSGHSDGENLQLGAEPLAFADLRERVEGSQASLKILIVDACQSGGLTGLKGVSPLSNVKLWLRGALAARGTVIITSAALGEFAQESEDFEGSFFTHHLLWGLRGAADTDGDQIVSLAEAYSYAYERTVSGTWSTVVGRQHPTIEMSLDQRGDVALTDLSVRNAKLLFPGDTSGVFAIFDPRRGRFLAEIDKPRGKHQVLAVAAGTYWVAHKRKGRIFAEEISVEDDQTKVVTPARMTDRTREVETALKGGSGRRRGPWQIVTAYALSSGVFGKTSALHQAELGLRWDLGPLAIIPRITYGETRGDADLDTGNGRSFHVRLLGLQSYVAYCMQVSLLDVLMGVNLGLLYGSQRLSFAEAYLEDEENSGMSFAFGAVVGLDLPIAHGWSLQMSWEADELVYPRKGDGGTKLSWYVKGALGAAYRF